MKMLTREGSQAIGKSTIIVLAALAVAGCQQGGGDESPNAPSAPTAPSDTASDTAKTSAPDINRYALDVLKTDRRFPSDFHREPEETEVQRTIYHLKSTDVATPLANGSGKFDLCTNDVNQGINWVSAHYADRECATLVDTGETERYYMARWEIATEPTSYRDIRVFKCSFTDRSVYDWDQPSTALARIDSEADAALVKAVADYLWYFSPNNNYGNAVLDTDTSEAASRPVYTMTELFSQINWDGQCNSAIVTKASYGVDPTSGILSVERRSVDGFLWQLGESGVETCDTKASRLAPLQLTLTPALAYSEDEALPCDLEGD